MQVTDDMVRAAIGERARWVDGSESCVGEAVRWFVYRRADDDTHILVSEHKTREGRDAALVEQSERAALTAALAHMWRPISELTREYDDCRILVAGRQSPNGRTAGYWWWHEDTVVEGSPFEHPQATFWCKMHFALLAPPMAGGE